jgi:hypothetical protein
MTPSRRRMTPLRCRVIDDMTLRNRAPKNHRVLRPAHRRIRSVFQYETRMTRRRALVVDCRPVCNACPRPLFVAFVTLCSRLVCTRPDRTCLISEQKQTKETKISQLSTWDSSRAMKSLRRKGRRASEHYDSRAESINLHSATCACCAYRACRIRALTHTRRLWT